MPASTLRWLMPATLCALASAATAQPSPPAAPRADPLDARAAVPAPAYDSALSRYRRTGEPKPIPWRDANDSVARIGGWRAYAREAQQPEASPSAPASAPTKPMHTHTPRHAPMHTPANTPAHTPAHTPTHTPQGHGVHQKP